MNYQQLLQRLEDLLDSGRLPECPVFKIKFVRLVLIKKAFIHYQYAKILGDHLGIPHAEVLRALLAQYNPELLKNLEDSGLICPVGCSVGDASP